MTQYAPEPSYKDLFRRTYAYHDAACYYELAQHITEPPDFYKSTLAFSPATYTPQSTRVEGAYLFPFVAPQQVPQSRVLEHVVYDQNLKPVSLANHIKAFYNGYEDHPDLPAYPDMDETGFEYIPGTSYYMGLLLPHFGHFILEVMTRIWLRLQEGETEKVTFIVHIVGQRDETGIKNNLFNGYWKTYFDAVGITADNFIVANRKLKCERLIVPQCAVSIGVNRAPDCFMSEQAVNAWQTLSQRIIAANNHANTSPHTDKIYISRRKVSNPLQGRALSNEEEVEELFVRKGFSILHPEDLTSEAEKHHILSQCSNLAALSGSGLMNSVFLPKASQTLTIISDQLNRGLPGLEQQIALDMICGHRSFAYYQDDFIDGAEKSTSLDITALDHALDAYLEG